MGAWKRLRVLVAALAMVTSLVAVGIWTQLGSGASTPAAPDTIIYSQQNGKNGTYLQYVPGDGSKSTTQSVTGAGGCATPNTTNPVLAFSANYYPNGYGAAPVPAIVGAYNQRTGVCQLPQAWSIEVGEGLVFAPGPNALTAGRVFSRAVLQLQRQDKSLSTDPALHGQLVERLGTTTVLTQGFSIPGPNGTVITADTGANGPAFDSIEVRVLDPAAGSVSVVGPTSTFTLANQICVGQTINTSSNDSQVTASATYVSNSINSSTCKSYTDFSAANGPSKVVDFGTVSTPGARMTMHIDWGTTAFCTPSTCAPTTIDFNDGNGPQAQTFCASANPPSTPAWCTVSQKFSYETDPVTGQTVTRIVEDWSGFGDPTFGRR